MKRDKTTLIFALLTSLLIYILVFTQFLTIFTWILPKPEILNFDHFSIKALMRLAIYCAVILASTPILIVYTWKLGAITSLKNRLFSSLIVLGLMIASVIIRKISIENSLAKFLNAQEHVEDSVSKYYYLENLNFEYYLLGGLILGCFLGYMIFRKKVRANE